MEADDAPDPRPLRCLRVLLPDGRYVLLYGFDEGEAVEPAGDAP